VRLRTKERLGVSSREVPSALRALNLLELLAETPGGLNLSQISRKLEIPKSSAYYLVTALARRDFVSRISDQFRYSLGTNAFSFARTDCAELELKRLCSPYINALSKELGLIAQVGIREGAEARIIHRSQLPGLRLDSWVGRHFDLHCTAIGKALVSYLPEEDVDKLLRSHGLARHNQNTLCSMEHLKAQFVETRRVGYAIDDEEHELGVRCVASPIFNHLGAVIAAICVFSPIGKLCRSEMPNVGREVVKSARELSRMLADSSLGGYSEAGGIR
jgi:IclR family KDG regulon transcriptional repressor